MYSDGACCFYETDSRADSGQQINTRPAAIACLGSDYLQLLQSNVERVSRIRFYVRLDPDTLNSTMNG